MCELLGVANHHFNNHSHFLANVSSHVVVSCCGTWRLPVLILKELTFQFRKQIGHYNGEQLYRIANVKCQVKSDRAEKFT